jgi:hypothetical protein
MSPSHQRHYPWGSLESISHPEKGMETQSLEQAEPPFLAGLDGLILYEDVGTGLRAKQALDLVPGDLARTRNGVGA